MLAESSATGASVRPWHCVVAPRLVEKLRPVIVIAAPRTGSTLMAEFLSSLPGLQYLNAESLNPPAF